MVFGGALSLGSMGIHAAHAAHAIKPSQGRTGRLAAGSHTCHEHHRLKLSPASMHKRPRACRDSHEAQVHDAVLISLLIKCTTYITNRNEKAWYDFVLRAPDYDMKLFTSHIILCPVLLRTNHFLSSWKNRNKSTKPDGNVQKNKNT